MADISKIQPPGSDTVYDIKDATAREEIDNYRVLLFSNIAVSAGTGNIATVNDSRITADHVVNGYTIVWGNSKYITSAVKVTTSAGKVVLNGTCTAATSATFQLVIPD